MKSAIVVTTINPPNFAMETIRDHARLLGAEFVVIGDTKSPDNFSLEGADFYSFEAQKALDFSFAKICPPKHYARKNIGYLIAARNGADLIIETDDDNIPKAGFEAARDREVTAEIVDTQGWANVYNLFSETNIWPRGLPLTELQKPRPTLAPPQTRICPIQQGLADENPDVDAVYRLAFPLPVSFEQREPVILDAGAWCPFNSQNTTFFKEAFLLTYLPYHCSFRMTDIWRSFVAQRILWECDWRLMFHASTVYQERNEHDLMKDFEDEVPGYLHNRAICDRLSALNLRRGPEHIRANLEICYETLISMGVVGKEEELLLKHWLDDMTGVVANPGGK